MIVVDDFRVEARGRTARAACRVRSENLPDTLWFEVPAADNGALDVEEPNWAAVALLYPAMWLGRRLVIEAPLSPRLLHALRHDLQRLLVSYDPRLSLVDVSADVSDVPSEWMPSGVGTGFSAGVDSFATLMAHSAANAPEGLRVTDLTVFNVGGLGHTAEVSELFEYFCARCSEYARRMGWGTYLVDSNMDDFYRSPGVAPIFQRTHTLRNAAAALVLQKRLRYYLYSSSYEYARIKAVPSNSMAYIDPILLPLLSSERLELKSSVAGLTRGQKTALVADEKDVQEMLDVCVASQEARAAAPRQNCSKCWKCNRTMLTLEALGLLDKFGAVFDVDYYRRNRSRLVRNVAVHASSGDPAAVEALEMARASGLPVPMAWMHLRRGLVRLHRSLGRRLPASGRRTLSGRAAGAAPVSPRARR